MWIALLTNISVLLINAIVRVLILGGDGYLGWPTAMLEPVATR